MSRVFILLILVLSCGLALAQSDTVQIRRQMEQQEQDWNRGDLVGFMSSYWNDEQLKFIGSKGITYGWKSTLANYQKSYDSKEKMGQLQFTLLSMEQLSADAVYVTGKWQLLRNSPVGGHFTLLWRKIAGKWVIVADHTS